MVIFNIMMSRDLGGIQQSFLDYNDALKTSGNKVLNVISNGAEIIKYLQKDDEFVSLPNILTGCVFSKIKLRNLINQYKPEIIIVHGRRAAEIATDDILRFAKLSFLKNIGKTISSKQISREGKDSDRNKGPIVVGVSHNYSIKRLKECDFILSITDDLKKYLVNKGYPEDRIYHLPNMITIKESYKEKNYRDPITIGSFGRFVDNKGFKDLINGFAKLEKEFPDVRLLIGGSGEEEGLLRQMIYELKLQNKIKLLGWINDKDKFFEEVDIFCCPSHHEPFGIVILEAMEHSTPIAYADSQGPSFILEDGIDALKFAKKSPDDLADKLRLLIEREDLAKKLSYNAYKKLSEVYSMPNVSSSLNDILHKIVGKDRDDHNTIIGSKIE